jgi:UDP-N-acetylmuramoyl-L-alanyl-D-glutamate--2,6-diaminopimelate ligase
MERPLMRFERSLMATANLLGADLRNGDVAISGLTQTSQEIEAGDLFLAFPGAKTHGARYALEAKKRGARAVLTDSPGAAIIEEVAQGLPIIEVSNPRRAAGILSAWFYNEPMRDIYSVGITGTNGKTTTTTLLHQIWTQAGRESGLIGTVETRIGNNAREF